MEALGGAASVVGVVSLAIQVCEELKKVQDFWRSVKEAPDDFARISTELNLFMTWLAVIANNYQRQGFSHGSPNEIAATDTLKLCLATVHDMNDGVKDLESRFFRGLLSRRWASVKFVLREDKREKVMKQIERMKTLLMIVQTCYIGEIQEAGFKSLSLSLRPKGPALQAIGIGQSLISKSTTSESEDLVVETPLLQSIPNSRGEIVSFDPMASPQATCQQKHRTTQQEKGAYNLGFAILRLITMEQESILIKGSGKERRISAQRTRCDLRIAQWLWSRGFSWQSFGVYGSWQHSFRTFRYIPANALIVEFCCEGDLANVQRMFDKGLASPFDRVAFRDEDWSLLHVALGHCHAQLCKFLIECGLGHGSASGMSRKPILSLTGSWSRDWTSSNPSAHLDILRIMINEGQYDPMEEADGRSLMHAFDGSPTVYQWLLHQEEFFIDLEQRSGERTMSVAQLMSPRSNGSKCLEALIAYGSDLNHITHKNFTLLSMHYAVLSFPIMNNIIDFPKRIKVLWDAGADIHTPELHNNPGTPLNLLFDVIQFTSLSKRTEKFTRSLYDRLDDSSITKHRPRTSRSLWRTWYPGNELSILEVAQRYLDAWMELLLEAGLDVVAYGRREDQMHPERLVYSPYEERPIEARVYFEYGDHVSGCRIHVTEIWLAEDPAEKKTTTAEDSTMPGSWDFDDE